MSIVYTAKRLLALTLAGLMLLTSLHCTLAQAALVSTGDLVQSESARLERDQLAQLLQRQQAVQTLQGLGIDPTLVQQRIAHTTADELQALNAQVADGQAGGSSVVGVVVLIFVVLIVLDLLGTTDIFPAIKPINSN